MARKMKHKFTHVNAFSKEQAADIGLNTGDISTMDILTKLMNKAAIAKADSDRLKGGYSGAELAILVPVLSYASAA